MSDRIRYFREASRTSLDMPAAVAQGTDPHTLGEYGTEQGQLFAAYRHHGFISVVGGMLAGAVLLVIAVQQLESHVAPHRQDRQVRALPDRVAGRLPIVALLTDPWVISGRAGLGGGRRG